MSEWKVTKLTPSWVGDPGLLADDRVTGELSHTKGTGRPAQIEYVLELEKRGKDSVLMETVHSSYSPPFSMKTTTPGKVLGSATATVTVTYVDTEDGVKATEGDVRIEGVHCRVLGIEGYEMILDYLRNHEPSLLWDERHGEPKR